MFKFLPWIGPIAGIDCDRSMVIAPFVFCLAVFLSACSGKDAPTSGTLPKRVAEIVPVLVATVAQRDMPLLIDAIGNVEVLASVAVKSRVDGQITRTFFADGQEVAKGQMLYQIDSRPFVAELKHAEAALQKDKAQLEHARSQEQRYEDLLRKNFVSREAYAQIKLNLDSAAATLQSDRAAIENAKLQLEYATIRAPINGQTGKMLIQEGSVVKANDVNPLVIINQLSPIYVNFSIPEQQLTEVRKAMAREALKVNAQQPDGTAVASGRLTFVDNSADTTTATIKLKATFDNQNKGLWPGQFVKVVLVLGEQKNAVVVASRSVLTGPKGQYVYVVGPQQTVDVRNITVDRVDGADTIISKGLAVGDVVVIDGQSRLLPGGKISIKEEKKAS